MMWKRAAAIVCGILAGIGEGKRKTTESSNSDGGARNESYSLLETRAMMLRRAGGQDIPILEFDCQNLKHVIKCHPRPKFLNSGSFGQAWLVETPDGRQAVLKMLYINQGGNYMHLTKKRAAGNLDLLKSIQEAKDECEISKTLHKQNGSDNPDYKKNGGQRIMGCFGHNLDTTQRYEPLYLLLENCGGDNLNTYMARHTESSLFTEMWSLTVLGEIMKGILEGLEYLQSFEDPWIHHDLKPDNIAVKVHQGRHETFRTVHLIDLGATVKTSKSVTKACKCTSVSPDFVPFEWNRRSTYCSHANYVQEFPKAFDMYAVGMIMLNMLTGWNPFSVVLEYAFITDKKTQLEYKDLFDFNEAVAHADVVWNIVKDDFFFDKFIRSFLEANIRRGHKNVLREAKANRGFRSFFEKVKKTLDVNAAERPTAEELLKDSWMMNRKSYDDPDFLPKEKGKDTAARAKAINIVGAALDAQMGHGHVPKKEVAPVARAPVRKVASPYYEAMTKAPATTTTTTTTTTSTTSTTTILSKFEVAPVSRPPIRKAMAKASPVRTPVRQASPVRSPVRQLSPKPWMSPVRQASPKPWMSPVRQARSGVSFKNCKTLREASYLKKVWYCGCPAKRYQSDTGELVFVPKVDSALDGSVTFWSTCKAGPVKLKCTDTELKTACPRKALME